MWRRAQRLSFIIRRDLGFFLRGFLSDARRGLSRDGLLLWAAKHGQTELIEISVVLLKADINVLSDWSRTPLMRAAVEGHTQATQSLIHLGARVELAACLERQVERLPDETALFYAVSAGHIDTAIALMDAGADVNWVHYKGYTPICSAAEKGDKAMVNLLIDRGAFINPEPGSERFKRSGTPLIFAAEMGQLEMVRFLHEEYGAELESTDEYGHTALATALMKNHLPVASYLIMKGARVPNWFFGSDNYDEGTKAYIRRVQEEYYVQVEELLAEHLPDNPLPQLVRQWL